MKFNSKILILTTVMIMIGSGTLRADSLDKIAKEISKGSKKLKVQKVAVLAFPYHDGRQSQGSTIISERLTTKIVSLKKLDVIERTLLEKVLKELNLQTSGAINEDSAKKIGQILGVEAIVSGTLIDLGNEQVEINARLIMSESGQILVAASGDVNRFWKDSPTPTPRLINTETVAQQNNGPSEKPGPSEAMPAAAPGPTPMIISNRRISSQKDSSEYSEDSIWDAPVETLIKVSGFNEENLKLHNRIEDGLNLINNEKGQEAQVYFEGLQKEWSGREKAKAFAGLGVSMSLFQQGKVGKAFRLAQELVSKTQWSGLSLTAQYLIGRYMELKGNAQKAKKNYLQVIRSSPFSNPLVLMASEHVQRIDGTHYSGQNYNDAASRSEFMPSSEPMPAPEFQGNSGGDSRPPPSTRFNNDHGPGGDRRPGSRPDQRPGRGPGGGPGRGPRRR